MEQLDCAHTMAEAEARLALATEAHGTAVVSASLYLPTFLCLVLATEAHAMMGTQPLRQRHMDVQAGDLREHRSEER
eukprot:1149846-Pelagomonas_calceolata.AAC.1